MNPFEKLNKNELFSIALEFDLPDLLKFCNLETRINDLICEKKDIWLQKLAEEFPENIDKINPKKTYQKLYWERLKEQLKYPGTVKELLNTKKLELSINKLSELPKEIGNLTNLQSLKLDFNELSELPKEISNLTNLQELDLSINELSELPKEIGKLTNL